MIVCVKEHGRNKKLYSVITNSKVIFKGMKVNLNPLTVTGKNLKKDKSNEIDQIQKLSQDKCLHGQYSSPSQTN